MIQHSIRSLARELGLSRTTVSDALRNSNRVGAATRRRVLELAKNLGYHYNPLAGIIMAEIKRTSLGGFRGVVATVDFRNRRRSPPAERFHAQLRHGVETRAAELGFKVDHFVVGEEDLPLARFDRVLRTRSIRGIVILPSCRPLPLDLFDWKSFASVYADYTEEEPGMDAVCCDHYRSMVSALLRLHRLGYRRPGLVLNRTLSARVSHRWQGAYRAVQRHHLGIGDLAALVFDEPSEFHFASWFKSIRPDVVLAHNPSLIDWMQNCGARVPETHGFFCLNRASTTRNCTGLDQQPALLGARSVELVISKLYTQQYGLPAQPVTAAVPARWIDGGTLHHVGHDQDGTVSGGATLDPGVLDRR